MKKFFACLFALLLCAAIGAASAQAEQNVYDVLTNLLCGRTFTLTQTIEDVSVTEDTLSAIKAGEWVCTAVQEGNQLCVRVTQTDSAQHLLLTLTAEGMVLETNLWAQETISCDWATLAPRVTCTTGEDGTTQFKVSMTGPSQELINFSCKVGGTDAHSYGMECSGGFITADGSVFSLWDSVRADADSTARDFAYTYDENELTVTSEGTQITDETGIIRADECTIWLNEDEVGTFRLRTEQTLK